METKPGSWKIVLIILAAPLCVLLYNRPGGDLGYALALLVVAGLFVLVVSSPR